MHMKRAWLLFALLSVFLFLASCSDNSDSVAQTDEEPQDVELNTLLKGVSLSPRSFSQEDFLAFFEKAKEAGTIITWAGDWQQLADETSAPHVVAQLASQYKYEPMIIAQFFDQDKKELLRPMTAEVRQEYLNSVEAFAKKYQPEYLGLGIEVNILYEASPKQFEEYVLFYNKVYDAVKAVSPETKIFTVFQLERMKGLHGGLFGAENDPALSQWQLLDKFETDVVAFTTYPGLIYDDPSEIPKEYYLDIQKYTQKPILFTETGWFREGPTGWESSEEEQAAFISLLFDLTKELKPQMIIWSFLYDPASQDLFNSMGLLRSAEETSAAWEAWIKE